MGGQTLTRAICRSGISGLGLFFTTGTGFGLLGLGGWWVGQCHVLLRGWQLRGWSSRDRLWLKPQGSRRPNHFFMVAFFSLRARGFLTAVLVAGGGFTPADCEVPATAMVTIFAEAVEGSVLAVSAMPPAGTSSPASSVPVTFWRLGLGGEAEGLQNR
jgi:hypothetical protein